MPTYPPTPLTDFRLPSMARDEEHEGPVTSGAWSFRDEGGEEWRGLLFALRRPEAAGEYAVYLRADARGRRCVRRVDLVDNLNEEIGAEARGGRLSGDAQDLPPDTSIPAS